MERNCLTCRRGPSVCQLFYKGCEHPNFAMHETKPLPPVQPLRRSDDWPKVDAADFKPSDHVAPDSDANASGFRQSTVEELLRDEIDPQHINGTPETVISMQVAGYDSLADVLLRAFRQAAIGKGSERHAQGQPFDQQPMQQLIALYGPGFALGQAAKKAQESQRLPRDRAVAELLGAINYLAGAVIALESQPTTKD